MNQKETLEILQKEFDYEENITKDLSEYFIANLEEMDFLSKEEIEELTKQLTIIRDDSEIHKNIFAKLIEYVKNGKNNY